MLRLLLRFLAFGFIILAGIMIAQGLFWLALFSFSIAVVAALIVVRTEKPEDDL